MKVITIKHSNKRKENEMKNSEFIMYTVCLTTVACAIINALSCVFFN